MPVELLIINFATDRLYVRHVILVSRLKRYSLGRGRLRRSREIQPAEDVTLQPFFYLRRRFISFKLFVCSRGWVVHTSKNPSVKLRLGEISRRSAELSAVSLKLEEMALQLDRLRKLHGRMELLSHRNCDPNRKLYRAIGNGRDRA
jgi:hypothetical protein